MREGGKMPIWYSKKLNFKLDRMIDSKTHLQLKNISSHYQLNVTVNMGLALDETCSHQDCVILLSSTAMHCFVIKGDLETVEKVIMSLDDKPREKVTKPTPNKVAVKSMRNFFKNVGFFQLTPESKMTYHPYKTVDRNTLTRLVDFSNFTLNDLLRNVKCMGYVVGGGGFIPFGVLKIGDKDVLIENEDIGGYFIHRVKEFSERGYTDQQLVEALTQCMILEIHEE